jgi:Zn-dependent protease/CBS domain-containing protein
MNWSFPLAKVKGIRIQVHATFVLVLIWAALEWGVTRGLGPTGALYGIVFTSLLFLCVTLHELAHSLVAIHYGVQVRDITLLPIGGLARLEGELKRPTHEFWVAISGPAVNIVLAAVLGAVLAPWLGWHALTDLDLLLQRLNGFGWERLMVSLLTANVGLALFNLLPAFPMDGGRVLRALLASRMNELNATRIAMRIGQGMAVIIGLLGLATGALNWVLIAMFIFAGARMEWRGKQLRMAMQQVPASAALVRGGVLLSPDDLLARAIDITLRDGQTDFAAFDRGYLVGILTREDAAEGFRRYGANVPVQRVMRTDFPVAQTSDTLLDLQRKMEASGSSIISVTEGGRFLGLATLESVRKALQMFLQWGSKRI